jgi:DNA mismatch repair protein MLH1
MQVVLPAAQRHLRVPHEHAKDGTFVQIASLEQLYKVFERC